MAGMRYTAGKNVFNITEDRMGLFQQAKWRPLAGMLINLIVSIALVKAWGICGVLVGTIVADWSTYMWFDPLVINKYGFKNAFPIWRYYLKFLKYFLLACVIGIIDVYICSNYFTDHGWLSVIIHAVICGVSVPAIYIGLHFKTKEGKYIIGILNRYASKIKKRFHV